MAPYFLRSLIPPKEKREQTRPLLEVLRGLTWLQLAHFFCGWIAWTCDAFDFFSVSLSVSALQEQFGQSTAKITTAITLTLLLRSVGAFTFGILSDRYGRKWPLVANLALICTLEIIVGFAQTFEQFLAARALFGVGMGGIWGLASSTALENMPVEARGLGSGILQQGYAVGYLLAACTNLILVPRMKKGWRTLFWCAATLSGPTAIARALLPESEVFRRAKKIEQGRASKDKTKVFLKESKEMLKTHWLRCVYAIFLMAGFNFLSHGSQDLYPKYLTSSKGFSEHDATIATIIGNCGAISGGALAGYVSQHMGRRLTIVVFVVTIGAFIPLWILPSSFSTLSAGAFWVQFGVQGAWGVIPIQLAEMSPPAFRATFPGVAYQLGNMISAASAQIEATGAAQQTTTDKNGKVVPDYAKVQGIFIGVIAAYVIIITILGPENHGSHFEQHKAAFEEGAGRDDAIQEEAEDIEQRTCPSIEKEEQEVEHRS
ncbi:hypothetical protein AX15_002086 [Amanita polypyramis BW_CC]|nr:hypothetical protein AX15_002086 [Amanita polypyramis BW_CC]